MFNLFARIGRKKWAQHVVNTTAALTPAIYYGTQMFGLDILKNVFTAQSSSGEPELLSEDLQSLINETYEQIKNTYHIPALKVASIDEKMFGKRPIKVQWFCSSTLEPLTFGLTHTTPGVLIGLPTHYNYEKVEDLPDDFFRFNSMTLFTRLFNKKDRSNEYTSKKTDVSDDSDSFVYIDRNSDLGREYANSIILSREAKKYSIARELYLGDSYDLIYRYAATVASILLSIALSRGVVRHFRLIDAHVSQRISVYILSALVGNIYHNFLISKITESSIKSASEQATNISEDLKLGCQEYIEKLDRRRDLLKKITSKSSELN